MRLIKSYGQKDEFGGVIVIDFVGLKLKMYSMKKFIVKNIIQQKEKYCN